MQAIIPVAGAGTRLRPLTYTQPKVLIAVAGKPILSFIIDNLKEHGISDFVFVIGYLGDKIKDFVTKNYPEINARFVVQDVRDGLGHAILSAREVIDESRDLVIQLGDTILDVDTKQIFASPYSTLCVKKVEDPRRFGVAEIDSAGFINNVVEKPAIPRSNMALVGFYFFKETGKLFDALAYNVANNIRATNEFHLADGIQKMIKDGVKFNSYKVEHWFDLGKKDILLETNAILLKRRGDLSEGKGNYNNSIIIPPVSIGEGATIQNSIIGPYVTVGEHTNINYSIIRNSIVGSYTKLENVTLHDSLIGSDASISGLTQSLNIGDNTEIDLRGERNK